MKDMSLPVQLAEALAVHFCLCSLHECNALEMARGSAPVSDSPRPTSEPQSMTGYELVEASVVAPPHALIHAAPKGSKLPVISRPYLMVTFIPYYEDEAGQVWLERLWHRDFARHLTYIKHFTLLGPRYTVAQGRGVDLVRLEVPAGVELRFAKLPRQGSRLRALLQAPRTFWTIWSHVGRAEVVHSGVVGWPYPVGWLANVSAALRRKQLLIYVESAPWRDASSARSALWRRAESALFERLASWSVNRATISFYTHPTYRESLLTVDRGRGFVLPASWIDEADLLSLEGAQASWLRKRKAPRTRFLFAARLTSQKGLEILLQAIAALRERNVELDVDIIGTGELLERCREVAATPGSVRVAVLPPIPYEQLLTLIGEYHAVLVPTLSDEQPRIVFDAYSQAVPIIASDTDGLRPYVSPGTTGMLLPPADAPALAGALEELASSPARLAQLGEQALRYASTITHGRMHEERWRLMVERLGA